jgi:hypothetical protein
VVLARRHPGDGVTASKCLAPRNFCAFKLAAPSLIAGFACPVDQGSASPAARLGAPLGRRCYSAERLSEGAILQRFAAGNALKVEGS